MPCASCGQHRLEGKNLGVTGPSNIYPFGARDIQVIEGTEPRRFKAEDWPADKHKLLILLPEIFTPTCTDQITGMKKWYDEFQKFECEMILLMSDSVSGMLDWFNGEELLQDRPYKAFSSYMLLNRLSMLNNGRAKRGAIFVMKDGETVKQEAFGKVAPSFAELHRVLYAYSTGDSCGSDWTNPQDSLTPKD